MRILIVDDFGTMRKILKNILKDLGYTDVLEAEDGESALQILRKEKIDLVISDWNMPKMDGLALLKAIRSDEALKNTPVLMVTAEAQKQNVIEAIKAGVNNYVIKPFTPEVIQQKIAKIFSSS
ncbi:MAG: response regulator [Deltaproteobacteria bacterium]|nr:MAG: response regulator [Deltaproteobacteria bacterium]